MWRKKEIKKFLISSLYLFNPDQNESAWQNNVEMMYSTWDNVNYARHHDMILVLLAMIFWWEKKMQIHNQ